MHEFWSSRAEYTKTGVKTAAFIFVFYIAFNLFNLHVFGFCPYNTKYTDGKSVTSYIVAAIGLMLLIGVGSIFTCIKSKMLGKKKEENHIGAESLGYQSGDYM